MITTAYAPLQYAGNGSTKDFSVTWPYFADTDLVVTLRDDTTGTDTLQAISTDYTATTPSPAPGTGTVTFVAAPASGETVVIERAVPLTQQIDYVEDDAFSAASHEEALDRACLHAQERKSDVDHTPKFPASDPAASIGDLPSSVVRAGKYLGFDTDGEPVAFDAPADTTALSTFGASLGLSADAAAARTLLEVGDDDSYGNLLINGDFAYAPKGNGPFTAVSVWKNWDCAYLFPKWKLVSDGSDIVDVQRQTSVVPTNRTHAVLFDVETAEKKYGFVQLVEERIGQYMRGESLSLGFWARTTAAVTIKAAVISSTNGDGLDLADIVSAWGGQGTDPTLAGGYSYEDSSATSFALSADTWTWCEVKDVTISGTAKMIGVFFWADVGNVGSNNVGDCLYVSAFSLTKGMVAVEADPRPTAIEVAMCHRFHQHYAIGTGESRIFFVWSGTNGTGSSQTFSVPFFLKGKLRTYNAVVSIAAITEWTVSNISNLDASNAGDNVVVIEFDVAASSFGTIVPDTTGDPYLDVYADIW